MSTQVPVVDIETAVGYYRDVLGFAARRPHRKPG